MFDVTAPAVAGTYTFQWSMVQDGVDWFNDVSPALSVLVSAAAAPPPGGGAPAPTSRRGGENANGDAWINDKCEASIGSAPSAWPLLAFAGLLAFLRRRNS
jgi:MYXO-CTERM domain-containing protein